MAITTYQPFKAVYALLAVLFEACRLPLWILMYIPRAGRPHQDWTLRQALRVRIVRAFLYHASAVQMKTPLSLKPGSEKKRFVVLGPADRSVYIGPAKDSSVKPEKVGGTWYPTPYEASEAKVEAEDILLHFHGGAYIIGDGREADAGYVCRTLVKRVGFQYAFAPQYRLASNPRCRFPAQLQDAITSYSYLVNTLHIPPHRITLSGDSAGANLVLALLRYIQEYGRETGLPQPACAFLWSPWVNIEAAKDPANLEASPFYLTDYLTAGFGSWGSSSFASGLDASQPYLSPILHPFATPVPMFLQSGGAEVLYHDHVEITKKFGDVKGNVIDMYVESYAPHDIALVGKILGFTQEFDRCADKARDFWKTNRRL